MITRSFLVLLLLTGFASAQSRQVEPGPIPTQITTAKKVFIANGGGDEPGIYEPFFSGGADRTYNEFYAGIKSSGRYELVGSPAEADLLFDIQFTVIPDKRPSGIWGSNGTSDNYDAVFRLEIRDRR